MTRCKNCGGRIVVGDVASECFDCGASVDPGTGEPYISDGKVVRVAQFGGRDRR